MRERPIERGDPTLPHFDEAVLRNALTAADLSRCTPHGQGVRGTASAQTDPSGGAATVIVADVGTIPLRKCVRDALRDVQLPAYRGEPQWLRIPFEVPKRDRQP
jgi:hypothetical protein